MTKQKSKYGHKPIPMTKMAEYVQSGAWYREANPRSKKIADALAKIKEGAISIRSTEEWKKTLQFYSQFHNYSFRNLMLVTCQKPNATKVAGEKQWNKVGRKLKKGAQKITILAPFKAGKAKAEDDIEDEDAPAPPSKRSGVYFGEVPVYDVNDTTGDPIPKVARLLEGESNTGKYVLDTCEKWLAGNKVKMVMLPMGEEGANGYCDYANSTIAIAQERKPDQQAKTCIHEIAHLMLHTPHENNEPHWKSPVKGGEDIERSIKEVEAESVAFIVCDVLGIDSAKYSFGYVASWAKGEDKLVGEVSKRVQDTARFILKRIFTDGKKPKPEKAKPAKRGK